MNSREHAQGNGETWCPFLLVFSISPWDTVTSSEGVSTAWGRRWRRDETNMVLSKDVWEDKGCCACLGRGGPMPW